MPARIEARLRGAPGVDVVDPISNAFADKSVLFFGNVPPRNHGLIFSVDGWPRPQQHQHGNRVRRRHPKSLSTDSVGAIPCHLSVTSDTLCKRAIPRLRSQT